jgi:hypothetical protein
MYPLSDWSILLLLRVVGTCLTGTAVHGDQAFAAQVMGADTGLLSIRHGRIAGVPRCDLAA